MRDPRLFSGALLLGAVVVLFGCGGGGEGAGGEAEGGRTIEHELGTTEVPEDPERIVSLGGEITETLIALDRKPVADLVHGERAPALQGRADGIEALPEGGGYGPNLEQTAALEPDLIFGWSYQEEVYDELSEIAPTVILSDERDFEVWVDEVARATGAEEKSREVLADYEEGVEEVKKEVEGLQISVVRPQQEALLLYGPPSNAGAILEDLGVESQPVPRSAEDWSGDGTYAIGEMSLEYIPELSGEHIFVISYDIEDGTPEELLQQPLWQELEAVREGRAHLVEGTAWTNHGPLGAELMIEEVEEALTGEGE